MTTSLPADSHVHSQWSWDALAGSMEETCRRAAEIGLPAVAFTEHADFTPWLLPPDHKTPDQWRPLVGDGVLTPPPLDLNGYRDCLRRCRERFGGLCILSGVELGEPHWHASRAAALLGEGGFDRVLASVHSAPADGGFDEIGALVRSGEPAAVLRGYLAETAELISRFGAFDVLAHIDYPVRYWPREAGPCDPREFEEEYRHVLRTLADAGKALEVNTQVPLHPQILAWWRDEGGQAITFASDAHEPAVIAAGFADAVRVADAAGFAAGRDPWGFWHRKWVCLPRGARRGTWGWNDGTFGHIESVAGGTRAVPPRRHGDQPAHPPLTWWCGTRMHVWAWGRLFE